MTALSNMPITNSEQSADGQWITDTFAKSHRMSTYLVAYAVTNFESRTDGNISVWTRPGFGHSAEYALRIAGKILRHYEDFFGIEYPLPKMDMIALPDFNAGAMENWGLITYRETAMLFDPSHSSLANKQRVAVVVAHELAHQWFGNLVTPKWWDDLWLNEGFASFVEYIGVDYVEPSWRMLDQFIVEEVHEVLSIDCLSSSHPISIPVNNPDEISEIFDHISYAKGASVIRMMAHFLGDDVFKLGLQRYLRALKYSNAEQADLWAHLIEAQRLLRANATSVDVKEVMNSWTLQTGYPVVTVTRDYSASPTPIDQPIARLEQARYQPYKLISGQSTSGADNSSADSQRWEIPITLTSASEQNWRPTTRLWMHANETAPIQVAGSLLPKPLANDEWLLVNTQQVGYYRVNYDLRNWRLLINQLQRDHTKIPASNRAQLLNNLFELAMSSLVDYPLALEATRYLEKERDYLPLDTMFVQFNYIDEMLTRTPIYGAWEDYYSRLLAPLYDRYRDIPWTRPDATNKTALALDIADPAAGSMSGRYDENDMLAMGNHVNAVLHACNLRNDHCVAQARDIFRKFKTTNANNIKPEFRFPVYCTAIRHGNKDDWDFLWRVYERAPSSTERDRIIRALACSNEMWILNRYLELTFNKTGPIRRQDGTFVFRYVAVNNYGRDIAFNYMREHWPTIREFFGRSSFNLGQMVKSMAMSMNTQVELDQFKAFFGSTRGDVGTSKRAFQIAIEAIETNVAWLKKYYKVFENWLQMEAKSAKAQRI